MQSARTFSPVSLKYGFSASAITSAGVPIMYLRGFSGRRA